MFLPFPSARYIVERIPGAKYVELPGEDPVPWAGDSDAIIDEVEEFVTGTRHVREPDRMLATVMFTDIVNSTARASELGDSSWRELIERHDGLMRREIERHRGREVKTMGTGFLLPSMGRRGPFAVPARLATRCAGSESRSEPGCTLARSR